MTKLMYNFSYKNPIKNSATRLHNKSSNQSYCHNLYLNYYVSHDGDG